MRKPGSSLGSSQFRLQWPVLDRLQVLLASSFSYLGSTLSSSGPFALLRRLCPSCFLPPLQPISKCSTWVNFGTVSFLRCFLSVFSPFFTHFSVQGTQHWRPRVYFRVGFSPCASHFDNIRDVSKSPVPPCCSNGPSVNRRCCGCRFSRIPQPCSVNWGLRPRLFRVVSAATCPAAALHVNLCPKPSLASGLRSTFFLGPSHHCDPRFDGAWGP